VIKEVAMGLFGKKKEKTGIVVSERFVKEAFGARIKSQEEPPKFLIKRRKKWSKSEKDIDDFTPIEHRMRRTVHREFIEAGIELRSDWVAQEVLARMKVAPPEPEVPAHIKAALDEIAQKGVAYVDVYTCWGERSGFVFYGFAGVEYGQLQLASDLPCNEDCRLFSFDKIGRLVVKEFVLICDSDEIKNKK